MNMISSIVAREYINLDTKLNIVSTPIDNKYFIKFIEHLGYNLLDINDMYFGSNIPNLLLCNNKIDFSDQIKTMSIRYHIPTVVIDHSIKSDLYDQNKLINIYDFPCSYHIALNQDIYNSWGKYHDQILNYNLQDKNNINTWKNLLYQISKRIFSL